MASKCNGRSCGLPLDLLGDHRASYSAAGRLKWRAMPFERMLARVGREAGARVRMHVLVRDLDVPGVHPDDGRKIEVIMEGTPLYGGRQLAVDATLVSPLGRDGGVKFASDSVDGAALATARAKKETDTYADVVRSHRCQFLTAGMEVGGRWAPGFVGFLRALARFRAESAPARLRVGAKRWWYRR